MKGLAICAGIGGIELGLALAVPDYQTIGYIECDPFAADVLAARMRDGLLPDVPIWSHVETWDSSPWIGNIEIISAGFPCQPWSVAGRKRGIKDERWIWRHISRTVREVSPQYVFLENVVGLLNTGIGHVLRDLAQSGYDAEWDVFSAQGCGAPHLRKRAFVLAYARSINLEQLRETAEARIGQLGDTGLLGFKGPFRQDCHSSERLPTWPPGPDELDQWEQVLSIDPTLEPTLCGMADGVAMGLEQSACQNRKERIRVLGNAVVPVVAAVAFLTSAQRAASTATLSQQEQP